jgi:excinuclease ABC subunit A
MSHSIRLSGVRQNNLKNLHLEIPLERLVCITGPSGSGKSSLAFDTLYAEGHRRYVESLSTYARQFFERLPKPDIDAIDHICPSIALEQNNPIKNSRSSVGTSTEIYDYLRLLFAKLGRVDCPKGHGEIQSDSPQSAAEKILARFSQAPRAYVGFKLAEDQPASALLESGFLRFFLSPEQMEVLEIADFENQKIKKKSLIVVDRLVLKNDEKFRLMESLETCFRHGDGSAFIWLPELKEFSSWSSLSACSVCQTEVPKVSPLLFSFNSPLGACPECKGFGNVLEYDPELIVPNARLSIDRGAIDAFEKKMMQAGRRKLKDWLKTVDFPTHIPFSELSADQKNLLFNGSGRFKGIIGAFKALEKKRYRLHVRVFLRRYQTNRLCLQCHGSRLKPESLWVKILSKNIFELCQMPLDELQSWFADLALELSPAEKILAKEMLRQIQSRLQFLNQMGLHYLHLARLSKTLSGGESQRINLANQLGAELSGTLYVLDEPSIGLHASDRDRLLDALDDLVIRGNSVVLVEHDLDTIKRADEIIELGPGSGSQGGQIVFQGSQREFKKSKSLTADYLRGRRSIAVPKRRVPKDRWLSLHGAQENNLKRVNLHLPLNCFIGVSGVSGSGKSTLIEKTLYPALARVFESSTENIGRFEKIFGVDQIEGVCLLDQSAIGKSSRSIPLSVIGGFDEVRRLFSQSPEASRRNLSPSYFSFNLVGGRCETCKGDGYVKTEMYFLDDLYLICEDCEGRRYKKECLQIKLRGKTIADVLQMSVSEAKSFFSHTSQLLPKLQLLEKVGLGYIRIGQSSQSLSGGESQRLKIAAEIGSSSKRNLLYILDEPTTGLHVSEIDLLIRLLNDLVDAGNTVLVIEHHLDVLKCVDWLIDLGPRAGKSGGQIVAEGSPEVVAKKNTLTGRYLEALL